MTSLWKPISRAQERQDRLAMRKQIERAVFRAVDARDQHRCRLCGKRLGGNTLLDRTERHHIVFRSAGGETTTANLLTLCPKHHADVQANRIFLSGDANHAVRVEEHGREWTC